MIDDLVAGHHHRAQPARAVSRDVISSDAMPCKAAVPVAGPSPCLQLVERDKLTRNGAGGHRWRARKPNFPRPGTPGKVAIDRTDRDLLGGLRRPRTAIRARAAARLQHFGTDRFERLEISAL